MLDRYVTDFCKAIETASSNSDRAWSLIVDTDPLIINTDVAVSLAVIVNEIITNAIQHSRPVSDGGPIRIVLKNSSDNYSIGVSDLGDGPADTHASGLGTRIVDALAQQLHATVTRDRVPGGYTVAVTVPHLTDRGT